MTERSLSSRALLLAFAACLTCCKSLADEPNPPTWPKSVQVFGPEDSTATIESAVKVAFSLNGGHEPDNHGQFSVNRFAFLFKPGNYDAEVPVGFYTQVAGLGKLPTDVVFTGEKGVYSEEGSYSTDIGALDTFWRSAENFQTDASFEWNQNSGMLWAVSQAAPLRRVVVTGDLSLFQYVSGDSAGYASGGFMANSQVHGNVYSGSQQQFITRNCEVGGWPNGVWNMVFVGTQGAPSSHCGRAATNPTSATLPYVTVAETPVIAEKPFITIDSSGKYHLNIPTVQRNRSGVDFTLPATQVDFSKVFVATRDDSTETINAKLSAGLHLVLTPGIYNITSPLRIGNPNQVVLGLGLATLVSTNGNAVIGVENVDGVRIAGLILEAGDLPTESLLEWGESSYSGNAANPGFLHDVFARVGGPAWPAQPQAKVMLRINSGNVVGDDLWLWRADHTQNAPVPPIGSCPCDTALIVNGDDVTFYGLATEHTLKDLVQWNGERGATYFFQAEMPYDVDQSYGDNGYVGYRVNASVKEHVSYGAGVYHYFRDFVVHVQSGISCPVHLESSFVSPLSVYLNGKGVMHHVLNDQGPGTRNSNGQGAVAKWLCVAPGPSPPSPTPSPPTPPPPSPCKVGAPVKCPDSSVICAGNECCPGDGSTCPSADDSFTGCPEPKKEDCTPHFQEPMIV